MTAKLNIFIVERLVALRARLIAFAFALAVGACLLAGPIAGPAQAASSRTVTNYTGPGMDAPERIAAGPDGGLWFTNSRNNSIGRIEAICIRPGSERTPNQIQP